LQDIISLTPKIFELNTESSNIFMTLKMIILTNNVNLNGAEFTEDFIDGIVSNQQNYIGIALVVDKERLENEEYDKLTHLYSDGELRTDMIGSFVNFEKSNNEDGSFNLIGEARVLKRFPKTCEAIAELYLNDLLRFSCEVSVAEYGNMTATSREIPYANGRNSLIGDAIVSSPAEITSKPTLLVASLIADLVSDNEDITNSNLEGGQSMTVKREFNDNNGIKTEYFGVTETAELSFDDIRSQLWTSVNDNTNSYYGIRVVYSSYCIVCDYDCDELYKISYSVSNNEVNIESKDSWINVEIVYQAKSIQTSSDNGIITQDELNAKCEKLNSELDSANAELETIKAELETVKSELSAKNEVVVLNETQSAEQIVSLGLIVEELKGQVSSLMTIKEERDAILAEKAEAKRLVDIEDLKTYALNSKRVTEAELTENTEIAEAIEGLDKSKISIIIAQRVVESELANVVIPEVKTAEEPVVVLATVTNSLLPEDNRKKWYQE